MTTFAQLSPRLKNFLRGWLLVLVIKEGLIECATVCVKSVVILCLLSTLRIQFELIPGWIGQSILHSTPDSYLTPDNEEKKDKLKGDDIINYINVKHSCQEFSLFQIERLGVYFSARPIREAARAVKPMKLKLSAGDSVKLNFRQRTQAAQAELSSVN